MSKKRDEPEKHKTNQATLLREIAEVGFNACNFAYEGNLGIVASLCELVYSGPESRGADQRTVVHVAARLGNKDFLEWCFLGRHRIQVKTELVDIDHVTPLRVATEVAALDCANFLIKRGARADASTHLLELPTPLAAAIELSNMPLADLYCKQPGVKLDPLDQGCRSALRLTLDHDLSIQDAPRTLQMLLRRCEDLKNTVVGPNNLRMLHHAARRGKIGCVLALLSVGANDDEPLDITYWLPIHEAASHGYGEILKILIHARKKRVKQQQQSSAPSAAAASSSRAKKTAAAVVGSTSLVPTNNNNKINSGTPQQFNTVQEALGPRDSNGMTPILVAAVNGHVDCVELLIRAGASADDRSDTGFGVEDFLVMGGRADRWNIREAPVTVAESDKSVVVKKKKKRELRVEKKAVENMSRRREELQLFGDLLAMDE